MALGVRIGLLGALVRGPGRAPARPAGRPPRRRVRRRPVRLGRDAGPRGLARLRARGARDEARRGRGGHRRVRQRRARRAAPVRARRDRPDRLHPGHRPRPTSARRSGSPPRCSPTTPRSGSSSSRTATTPPAPASPRPSLAAARGIQVETHLVGLGGRDEVLVERLAAPVDGPARRVDRGHRRHHVDGRAAGHGPPVRQRRAGEDRARDARRRAQNRLAFTFTPTDPGFLRFRVVVEAALDTFNQNDRADANTIVKGEPKVLVVKGDEDVATAAGGGARDRAPARGHGDPRGAAVRPRGARGVRLDRPRGRPAAAALGRDDDRAPGLRPRPRAGAGDGRRAARVRRGRLHRHAARGDAPGRHGRPRPAEAARRGARRRHRQVGLDGRLPLQLVRGRHGRRRHPGRQEDRHRQGGDPARRGRAHRAGRVRRRRVRRARRTGSCRPRPWAASTDLQSKLNSITPDGNDQHLRGPRPGGAVAQGREGDPAPHHPAHRRLVQQRAVRRDPGRDGGRRDHAVGGRRGRRRERGQPPAQARAGGRRPLLRRREPVVDPGHLPQGDAAGLRPADRRGAVLPDPDHSSPILRGIDGGFPSLLGYNGTTAKPAAQTVLVTARDDPLLAQWQYGLGRSVAWTSDSTGRWAKSWIGWDGFSTFFSQMVGWTFPGEESGGIEASFEDRGGRTYLRVESVERRRLGARLLPDPGRAHRAGPGARDGRPQPGRARRVRGADRGARQRRVRASA